MLTWRLPVTVCDTDAESEPEMVPFDVPLVYFLHSSDHEPYVSVLLPFEVSSHE